MGPGVGEGSAEEHAAATVLQARTRGRSERKRLLAAASSVAQAMELSRALPTISLSFHELR